MASTRLGKLVRNCDEPVTDLKPYEINILKIIHGMCGQEWRIMIEEISVARHILKVKIAIALSKSMRAKGV